MKLKSSWFIVVCFVIILISLLLMGATKTGYINNYLNIDFLNNKNSESIVKKIMTSEAEIKYVIENNDETVSVKKKSMDAVDCPFPISDYEALSQDEKNKLSLNLAGFMNLISTQREKCSDYFFIIDPLLPKDGYTGRILYYFNANKIIFRVKAVSNRLVTSTSTPPTFLGHVAIKVPASFGAKNSIYLFYYLKLNPKEFIELIKNTEIVSIDFMPVESTQVETF